MASQDRFRSNPIDGDIFIGERYAVAFDLNRTHFSSLLPYFFIALLSVLSFVFLDSWTQRTEMARLRAEQQEDVDQMASRAMARLDAYKTASANLAAFGSLNPDELEQQFAQMAAVLSDNNPSLISIALSKDYVIEQIYPFEDNKAAIGLDFRTREDLLPSIEKAMSTNMPVLMGPVRLVQGGTGLIVRAAVPTNPSYVFSVVVELDALLHEASVPIKLDRSITGVRVDGFEDSVTLFGDADVWDISPQSADIKIDEATNLTIATSHLAEFEDSLPFRIPIAIVVLSLAALATLAVNYTRRLITEKTAAQKQFQSAIDALEDAFVIYDEKDRLLYCNEKYLSYFEKSADLLVPGNTFEKIIKEGVRRGQYEEAVGREEEWIKERLDRHATPAEPFEMSLDNGQWIKVAESKTAEGYTVGVRVDITELKLATMRAEEASRAKSEFLNKLSHELKTPLSVLIGNIFFLKSPHLLPSYKTLADLVSASGEQTEALDALTQDLAKRAEKAESSGNQLNKLVEAIIEYARITGETTGIESVPVLLGDVLDAVREEYSESAGKKGQKIELLAPKVHVLGQPSSLQKLFGHIVANAIQYSDAGGIEITVEENEGPAVVRIRDEGKGISPDRMEAIFESFSQEDGSDTREFSGLGLGLAIAKRLVDIHEGEISVESELGEGTTFIVSLPKAASSA